jgi:hypothetical protein
MLFLPLFFALFFLAAIWLFLAWTLLSDIRTRHPSLHSELGSPRGFEPQATHALLMFLYTRRPERLGDSQLLGQAWLMRLYLPIYLFGFLLLVFLAPK